MGSSVGFANSKSIEFPGTGKYTPNGEFLVADIIGGGHRTAVLRTFSLWVKLATHPDHPGLQPFFCGGTTPGSGQFRSTNAAGYINGTIKWRLEDFVGTGGAPYAYSEAVDGSGSAPNIDDGNWHHVVIYNPVDSDANRANIVNCKMWLDGQPLSLTTDDTGTFAIRGFGGTIGLGAGNIGGSNRQLYFAGKMDEFAYWDDIVLTDAEVLELYGGGKPTDLVTFSRGIPDMWYRLGDFASYNTPASWWEVPNKPDLDLWSKRSMDFDGIDEFIDCGADSSTDISGDLTISVWLYPSGQLDTYPGIVCKGAVGDVNYQLTFNNNGGQSGRYPQFYTQGGNGNAKGTNSRVVYGVWSHVAIVVNSGGGPGSTTYYINGVATDTFQFTVLPPTAPGNPLILGKDITYNSQMYNGVMDEVAIFDEAKAIGDLWDGSGKPTDLSAESGLISYYRMGEDATFNGTDWTIPDVSTNSNDGTSECMDAINNIINTPDSFGFTSRNITADPITTDVPG